MVRVLANGDIVPDEDPRARSSTSQPNARATAVNRPHLGFVNNANDGIPAAHGANVSVFDAINDRLTAFGVPTWHAGPYTVRPVVSLGFLLSLLLMGFKGLLFSGILFFIAKYSQNGWNRDSDNGTATHHNTSSGTPGPSHSTPSASHGNWPGSGHRLGR